MRKFLELARSFRDEEDGAAMIEYSVLIGLITVATIVTIVAVGGWVSTQWTDLDTALDAAG
jgi:pilus assembly protein Flp/PilA